MLLHYQRRGESGAKCYGCDGAAEATAVLPMASPLTTSSTRRLRWRPSAVSLVATGWFLPKPRAVMEEPATPCSARKSRTESARRSERSEERRVGKEWRWGWAGEREKKRKEGKGWWVW